MIRHREQEDHQDANPALEIYLEQNDTAKAQEYLTVALVQATEQGKQRKIEGIEQMLRELNSR